jgi:hypothetical protein
MKQIKPLWLKNKLWTSYYVPHTTTKLVPLYINLLKKILTQEFIASLTHRMSNSGVNWWYKGRVF